MEWKYVKPLLTVDNINDFETKVCYTFPEEFRDCVLHYNGGRPALRGFDTNLHSGRAIKSFLSFNQGDRETVWKINEWNREELGGRYVAFAIDNFGNLICFDAKNDSIVFINHEDVSVEAIADSFSAFINCLHE